MFRHLHIGFLFFCLFFGQQKGLSQDFFKWLAQPEKCNNLKLARFKNGDLLLGGSPEEGLAIGQNRGIFLLRMNPCGKVLWATRYDWKDNYMELKDFSLDDEDNIVAYGSAYEGFDEIVFLVSVDQNGNFLGFRLFKGGTVDHFSFSVDVQGGHILTFGLLHDWNTQKHGFIAVFDQDLHFLWAKDLQPFESTGDAIFSADGGILCRSGPYIFRLDELGNPLWAFNHHVNSGHYPGPGPFVLPDGYAFEFYDNQRAFFYKIGTNGQLVWKTAQFPATNAAADLSLLPDGSLLAVYGMSDTGATALCSIRISPTGEILEQKRLDIAQQIQAASLHQSVSEHGQVNILGNPDLYANQVDNHAFLLSYNLDPTSNDCFNWTDFQDRQANLDTLQLLPVAMQVNDLQIQQPDCQLFVDPLEYRWNEYCGDHTPALQQIDSTIACGEGWRITLPDPSFTWNDGTPGSTRTLQIPGTYSASNHNCVQPATLNYVLHKSGCDCSVYLPNVFKPGADGLNGRLNLFSSCDLDEVTMTVYSRWGERVFQASGQQVSWDGTAQGRLLPAGVYIVTVQYRLLDEAARVKPGALTSDVLLIR